MQSAYDAFQEGTRLLASQNPHAAVIALERARDLEPDKGSVRETLARAYFRSGRFAAAGERVRARRRDRPGQRLRPLRARPVPAAPGRPHRRPPAPQARGGDAARPAPTTAAALGARRPTTRDAATPRPRPVVCCDLDGVIWRGDEPIAARGRRHRGAARRRAARRRSCRTTRAQPVGDVVAKLERMRRRRPTRRRRRSPARWPRRALLAQSLAPGARGARVRGPGRASRRSTGVGLRRGRRRPGRRGRRRLPPRLRLRRASTARRAAVRDGRPLRRHEPRRHLSGPRRADARARARSSPRSPPRRAARPRSRASPRRRPSALVRERFGTAGVVVGDRPSTDGALADRARLAVRARALGCDRRGRAARAARRSPIPPPPFVARRPRRARARARSPRSPSAARSPSDARVTRPATRRAAPCRVSCAGDRAPTTRRRARAPRAAREPRARRSRRSPPGGCSSAGARRPAPARLVGAGRADQRRRAPPPRFVSRGGEKLAAALDAFAVDRRAGVACLDAGASTGGFTDCLLQRGRRARATRSTSGAASSRGRCATTRGSPCCERTNVRAPRAGATSAAPVDLAVADLSFISLLTVAPALARCTDADADLVLLVKPQFEAGRARVGKGGIVRDPDGAPRRCSTRCATASRDAGLARGRRDGVAAARRRRQRRVPRARADAARPPLDDDRARRAVVDAVARRERRAVRVVGLVPHRDRPARARAGAHARPSWLARARRRGARARRPTPTRRARRARRRADAFADGLDLVISLGGDGTMLRTVDLVYEAGVPVLGVNVGQLGYLTEVEPVDFDAALDRLLAGDYEVAERMVLEVAVESDGSGARVAGARSTKRCSRRCTPAGSCGSTSRSTARSSRRTRPTA